MTTVDSQTIISLDTPYFVLGSSKDNCNPQVGVLKVTAEELGNPLDEPDHGPLTYFRKGNGRRPVSGGMKVDQATKSKSTNSSSKSNPPANLVHPHPTASNSVRGKVSASHPSSKDKGKR